MSLFNNATQYGSVSKKLHLCTAIVFILMLIIGSLMGEITDKPIRGFVVNIHKLLGLVALALGVLMLLWSLVNPKPNYPATMPHWEKKLARLVQGCLYLLLIAMPLSGWILSTSAGRAPDFFGLMSLPLPGIAENETVRNLSGEAHEILAWALFILVCFHVLGALKHRFIDKDNTFQRMMN